MALTPKLEIRQSQSLLMTPQLRQAINLLQMSNLELSEAIEQELSRNPLLEREDDLNADTPDSSSPTIDQPTEQQALQGEETAPDNIDYDSNFDDFGSDCAGYEEINYDWDNYHKSKGISADDDFDYFEQKLAATDSVYELLQRQIEQHFTTPKDKIIARILSEQLDDAGYFLGSSAEIAKRLQCPQPDIDNILLTMQKFEPTGIFARNLQECLKLQLIELNRYDPAIEKLLENLPFLAERKFKELQKICQVDEEDLFEMITDIKALNPKPLAAYHHDLTTYVIPDVFVRRIAGGDYRVELNNMSLPRLLINNSYVSQIQKGDKSAKRFLKENLSHANFLIKAMRQRANTILKVSEEIVKHQMEFFEKGIEYLKPLSLKDIAYQSEIHESTVSRVTSGKYMHTPRGIFELKYFFSAAAGSYIGKEDMSTLSIKHKIKQLIDNETPDNILSDDNIVTLLANEGIKIARRTVAKYREAQKLPTSAERKRNKR